jgi:protein tyrosine/serine phosphatase
MLAALEGPMVVHCAAGKDRTGFICALTHHIAGVSHDDMVADYLLTNDEDRLARKMDFLGPWIEKQTGLVAPREALRVAVSVNTDYLETAFAAVTRKHGSIDGYLTEALGVDEALRDRIRGRLLD